MSTLAVVLILAAVVVAALLIGGIVAVRSRMARNAGAYDHHLAQADHALEAARAVDRGWDRELMEGVAATALRERHPEWEYEALELVLVDDRPGVEEDRAHFEARDQRRRMLVVLARSESGWAAAEVR